MSYEELSKVLDKLQIHEEEEQPHEEEGIAAFMKKVMAIGSKGENLDFM